MHTILELYFQLSALIGTNEQTEQADNDCLYFREIIKALDGEGELLKSQIIEMKAISKRMRNLIGSAPVKEVYLINKNVERVIYEKNGMCSEADLRTWLLEEINKREARDQLRKKA